MVFGGGLLVVRPRCGLDCGVVGLVGCFGLFMVMVWLCGFVLGWVLVVYCLR